MPNIDYLIVAGGGGVADDYSAGAGGGGVLENTDSISTGDYPIVIGAGGTVNGNGANSSFNGHTAIGGGAGKSLNDTPADGGSGGGGVGRTGGGAVAGGLGTAGQGFNGGSGTFAGTNKFPTGGGGGASEVGDDGVNGQSGNGGDGHASTIQDGTTKYYGGGGGGGGYAPAGQAAGAGGLGGAGNGNASSGGSGNAGTANTGGGAGGAAGGSGSGANGGSGIVILSYVTTDFGTCTGGTITTNGSRTVHTFTSNGTFHADVSTSITVLPSVIDATSAVVAPTVIIDSTVTPSVLSASSEAIDPLAVGDVQTILPTVLSATSEVIAPTIIIDTIVTPSVLSATSSVLAPTFPGLNSASFGTRILSLNPLLFVTDTTPAKLVKVDTTDPENVTWETSILTGIDSAFDASLDVANEFIYIGGSDGKIVKVDINSLGTQTITNFSDSDDIITMEHHQNNGITFAGTENTVGELYILDERESEYGDMRLDVLSEVSVYGDIQFNIIEAKAMDSAFTVLGEVTAILNCDFKCLTNVLDNITPMKRTDVHVYLDSVELGNTDIDLSSIQISHAIGEDSTASFRLTRKHDRLNVDLEGNTRTITNQNVIDIYLDDHLEFTGKISDLDCKYSENSDEVDVLASGDEKENLYNSVLMSLPGLNERLSLYHVMVNNPKISNPYIDPTKLNPRKYKGILVDLGERRDQSVAQFQNFDNNGTIAAQIQAGTFNPLQNWTYFWSPTLTRFGNFTANAEAKAKPGPTDIPFSTFTFPSFNLPVVRISSTNSPFFNLGATSAIFFSYIGTSLSPISEDLWIITNANHKYQRIREDIITRLGDGVVYAGYFDGLINYNSATIYSDVQGAGYVNGGGQITNQFKALTKLEDFNINYPSSVKQDIFNIINDQLGYTYGVAPFKKVSAHSGEFYPKSRWEDRADGLYSVTDAGFNLTPYAQQVAQLEYQKLLNINGQILPDTSCQLSLTFDGYLYHGVSLLSRVNIDNTTQADIFHNNNGFPVSIKAISIDTSSMKVTITADNSKSAKELQAIDGLYPHDDDPAYNTPAVAHFIAQKSDLRTGLTVQ